MNVKIVRKYFLILLVAGIVGILAGCSAKGTNKNSAANESKTEKNGSANAGTAVILLASDLHYLSPSLTDHGEYFTDMVENSDGKTMQYSDEILEAFADMVIRKKPDALVLPGDLTFNGARKSHTDLVKKLRRIQKAGIPVLVIPGNHDLNNRNAASFHGNSYTRVSSITASEFEKIYREFGYSKALTKDTASSSYIYELKPGLRLLILDVNGVDRECHVPEETLQWMQEQLKNAQKEGCRVLSFSHQNLLQHSMFKDGYVIDNSEKVLKLYRKYHVEVNFTGHLHIQHIKKGNGFSEIATSALSIPPEHYAEIKVASQTLTYKTSALDVSSWAKKEGSENTDLLHFRNYAKEFYLKTCRNQAESELSAMKDSKLKQEMIDYFARRNYAYFTGQKWKEEEKDKEARIAWRKTDTFIGSYLGTLPVNSDDQNTFEITFR